MNQEESNKNILKGKTLERHFDLQKALLEFNNLFSYTEKDDRTIAILGGTFLEMMLEHILLAFLPENNKDVEKLMDYNQPLGSFSNKITIAYCLGLIDEAIKDDLTYIRKIRNEFAHDLYASFDNQNIQSWCENLKWHIIYFMDRKSPKDATTRDLFQVGVNTIISHLNGCIGIARSEKRVLRNNFKD